ncbi:MAG TPA: hypothetical protein VK752_26605 [Bryobacteraceae bacterium]|nr:hypothetical protein [Bryobacteraceae bacterium]
MTGQAARAVIGQTTFTSQDSGTSNLLVGGVGGVAYANNTLFVADSNRLGNLPINNRVLMFENLSHMIPAATAEIGPNTGRCPVCAQGASLVLGQQDFTSSNYSTAANGMRLPTGIATDGRNLAVADTANNRILIWKEIPTQIGQPADLVLGQPDFVTVEPVVVTQSSMRAPQGVWIQNGRLFVADTQNDRVLIWNTFPTKNNQPADLELGAPNFTTTPNLNLIDSSLVAAANTMLNPTSVTSDGVHVFVSDLGFNRVLIWNEIPTKNQQPADVEVGQINFITSFANDNTDLCPSVGTDASGNPIYPATCVNTLSFPRFALSDGTRLYIADAGNDRVLIFNHIPTVNGAGADVVLGQPDQYADVLVTSTNDTFDPNLALSASYATPSPTALAWDGTNLYVTDSLNYRVLVFTPEAATVPVDGVVNAASQALFAQGSFTFSGSITAGDCLLITISNPFQLNYGYYIYTVASGDTLDSITLNVANIINGTGNVPAGSCASYPNPTVPDPNVYAVPEVDFDLVKLVSRGPGNIGNSVSIAAATGATITTTSTVTNNVTTTTETTSGTSTLTATASAGTLSGGGNASIVAPGTIISIQGSNLSDNTVSTPADSLSSNPNDAPAPLQLGGVEVYIDGIRTPILGVSPNQVDVQVPFELVDTNSSSLYVRTLHNNGTVTVTTAVGLQISEEAPGLYAAPGSEPRQVLASHYSSYATGVISVDGTPTPADTVTVSIEDRQYGYSVTSSDTLNTIRDALVALINSNGDEKVTATASGSFTRIILRAKTPGSAGNGLVISASVVGETTTNATTGVMTTSSPTETLTAINSTLCCANIGGAPVTQYNPAVPGEMVIVYATGLGLVGPAPALASIQDGVAYNGPTLNDPNQSVSSIIGGSTGNVLFAGLQVGAIGIYQVVLQLSSGLPTNPLTSMTIAQNIYTSNIVTIPVFAPSPTGGTSQ